METWMITVLIIGAIIMVSVWIIRIIIDSKKKNVVEKGQRYVDKNQSDERLADWSARNPDDEDDKAVYSTDGKRIN